MSEYFGVLPNELPSGTDWENRLQAVERELASFALVGERITAVEDASAELRQLFSELQSKPPTSTSDIDSKLLSELPGDTPEADSDLPSTCITLKPDSELLSEPLNSTPKQDSITLSNLPNSTLESRSTLSELPIATPEVESNPPDELQGSLQETNTIIPRESTDSTKEPDSITPSESLSNTPEIDSNLPSESPNSTLLADSKTPSKPLVCTPKARTLLSEKKAKKTTTRQ